MEYYAVGDLHGVKGIVPKIRAYFSEKLNAQPDARIIFLGDYIDRGGYEAEVLKGLYRLHQEFPGRCFFLLGNHDFMLLELLYRCIGRKTIYYRDSFRLEFWTWWSNGGFTTIMSIAKAEEWSSLSIYKYKWLIENFLDNFVEMIPFFNLCVGKVKIIPEELHGEAMGGRREFRLTHAGPRVFGLEVKDPERRIWHRLHNCRESSVEIWSQITQKYDAEKQNPSERGGEGKNINVFGHTIVGEAVIRNQIDKILRPVDAGSFITGRVAVASLLNPGFDCLNADEYLQSVDEDREKYGSYLMDRDLSDRCADVFKHYFNSPYNIEKYLNMLEPKMLLNTTITLDKTTEGTKKQCLTELIQMVIGNLSIWFRGGRKKEALIRLRENAFQDRIHPDLLLMKLCNIALAIRGRGDIMTRSGWTILNALNSNLYFQPLAVTIKKSLIERRSWNYSGLEPGRLTYDDLLDYTGYTSDYYSTERGKEYLYGLADIPTQSGGMSV